MAHATNGRHTDNWWLEAIGSAVTQDANGVGTVTVTGGSTTTPGGTAPTTVTPVGGIARDVGTKLTRADGTASAQITDLNENAWGREAYAPVAEDNVVGVIKTEQRYVTATISTATTTVVKTGAGFVQTISIVGGTLGAVTVYDNTAGSGTLIVPTFTPTSTLPAPSIDIYSTFSTGLTIVTAAATVIQISYR